MGLGAEVEVDGPDGGGDAGVGGVDADDGVARGEVDTRDGRAVRLGDREGADAQETGVANIT